MDTPTKCKTPIGIVSYPHLFQPQKADEDGKPKYSVALVFTVEQQNTPEFAALKAAAMAAATKKFGAAEAARKFQEKELRNPFRYDGKKRGYPEGAVFINIRSDGRPGCVGRHIDPRTGQAILITEDMQVPGNPYEIYPGCLGRATVNAFYYKKKGNEGISFGLNNFQKTGEGQRLDSRKSAVEEFEGELAEEPADLKDVL